MPNATGLSTGVRVRDIQSHYRLYQWNGRNRPWVNDGENITDVGVRGWESQIVNTVLTSNVVTITTAEAHRLATNATVFIATNLNNDAYGGQYVVASTPSSTTFTYARTNSNVTTAYDGGTVQLVPTVAINAAKGVPAPNGTYRYFVAPVNENRALSRGRFAQGLPSYISSEVTAKNQTINITGIPSTHPDSHVTHWHVFRNQTGNYDSFAGDDTQDFWRVGRVAIGTTTFIDVLSDKDLPPIAVSFNDMLPPAFEIGFEFGGRLFGCRFSPITTGTATVNTNTTLIDFSGVSLPDGVVGATFRKDSDDAGYEIVARISTTQIALDRPFSGAMSAATYSISRDGSEIWFSEWDNFDSWGPRSEARRNRLFAGGPGSSEEITAGAVFNGFAYIFTRENIYRVVGKGLSATEISMSPTPVVEGIGCVGPDALWVDGGVAYFTDFSGFYAFDGSSAPVNLSKDKIKTTFLDDLAATQLEICATGSDGRVVEFAVPRSGQTENDYVYAFDLKTGTWWPIEHVHPLFYFRDRDENGKDALFYAQGKRIFQAWRGTNDGAPSGTLTGTITSTTTTTATDSTAAFYTTSSGLLECYVHFFDPTTHAHKGSRRISSNTATALTWSSSGAGGGTLTLAAGDRYHVAPVYMSYETGRTMIPEGVKVAETGHLRFELQGESTASSVHMFDIVDETRDTTATAHVVNRVNIPLSHHRRNANHAVRIESRTTNADIAIQEIAIISREPEEAK